ncbi:type II secretion system protein GspE (plasmid) [Enterobacteriaceae bacterium Kacie_13]|nr:type II secretion system protein GspE [Enterobacteriaceae bacterium Kacie_13]
MNQEDLTEFCQRYRVFLTPETEGGWCLHYSGSLLPWVYLYASRLCGTAPRLNAISEPELATLLDPAAVEPEEMSQALESMVAADSFSWLLENLPQAGLDALEDSEAPVIRLINTMLSEAVSMGASDIHIETFQHYFQVRYRLDGVMQEISRGDARLGTPLISRLKIMSKLDIAERRLPQDGRFLYLFSSREIDVRLSIIPVSHGERAVLRLLDQQQLPPDYTALGIPPTLSAELQQLIRRPHGIILVTGPTGSGKSSTLYASLSQLNQTSRTILTIEDPVEYKLPGVGQTQVNSRINLDFSRGLRALLRQDPDVVMIGEIRDAETARVAVQAALTGHLVFSTLHTNSAVGAVARLCDMEIEPWLLASALTGVLAQRLVRKLCPHCRQKRNASPSETRWLGREEDEPTVIYDASGCDECGQRGYAGRTGIYELVLIDTRMREFIQQRASGAQLSACARERLPGIQQDAREKILAGITTFEEVMRVIEEGE